MPRTKKHTIADDIVMNDGQLEHLYAKLKPLHQSYLKLAQHIE